MAFAVLRSHRPSWHDRCEKWGVTNQGDTMVRKLVTALFLTASLLTVPAMVGGCDREVSHKETVKDGPGGTSVKEETVTKKADGSVEKTTETKKVNP
jgi:hypothetical protein